MPLPRDKLAPYYDGKPRHLRKFFREYEAAATAAQLVDPAKTDRVIEFVKMRVAQFWSNLPEFKVVNKNWNAFMAAVLKLYPEVDDQHRYTLKDLKKLIRKQSDASIKTVTDLAEFHRIFLEISTWLVDKQLIGEHERNRTYREAFRPRLRRKIGDRLQILNPLQDPSTPYTVTQCYDAALYVLRQGGKAKPSKRTRDPLSDSDSDDEDEGTRSDSSSDDETLTHNRAAVPTTTLSPAPQVQIKQEPDSITPSFERFMQQILQHQQNQTNALTAAITSAISGTTKVASIPTSPPPAIPTTSATRYSGCSFCGLDGHFIQQCPKVDEYVKLGKAARDANGKVVTANGRFIPRGIPGQTLKERLDQWLSQNTVKTIPASTNIAETLFVEGEFTLPNFGNNGDDEDELIHRLEVFTAELQKDRQAKKRGKTANDVPGPAVQPKNIIRIPPRPKQVPQQPPTTIPQTILPPVITPTPPTPPAPPTMPPTKPDDPKPRYKLQSPADDVALSEDTMRMVLDGKLGEEFTLKHLLAVSPPMRTSLGNRIKSHRVEVTHQDTNVLGNEVFHVDDRRYNTEGLIVGHSSVPLREIPVLVNNTIWERALLDEGSTICIIRKDLWQELGLHANPSLIMDMESANAQSSMTLGEIQDVALTFGTITVYIQFQIMMRAPFRLLIGRPFFSLTKSTYDNIENHGTILTIRDPNDHSKSLAIPTMARTPARKEIDAGFINGK